jgi:hypothetical protein
VDGLNRRGSAGGRVRNAPASHGFERIESGNLVATYARSKFTDTRRRAIKYGAHGTTVKAYKPEESDPRKETG